MSDERGDKHGALLDDIDKAVADLELMWQKALEGITMFANSDDTLQWDAKERIKRAVAALRSTPSSIGASRPERVDTAELVYRLQTYTTCFGSDTEGLSLLPDAWNRLRTDIEEACRVLATPVSATEEFTGSDKDAARYRWLRMNASEVFADEKVEWQVKYGNLPAQLDDAIDAAMGATDDRAEKP